MRLRDRFDWSNRLPYLPLIIFPILLLSPVIFSGKALFWGTPSLQFVPWWVWSFDSLLSGRLPLWNPLVGMGAPLFANYQTALFYPVNWLYFIGYIIGDISGLSWTQAVLVAIHLIIASVGMATFIKRIGLSQFAQVVSSLAFGLSGYLVARAWFASINASLAWFPWIMVYTYDLAHEENRLHSTLKLGFVTGMQLLAGHAQTSWYTLILAIVWYGFWTLQRYRPTNWKSWQGIRNVVKDWGLISLAMLFGVGIASVQLIPTIEYLFQSQRASAVEFDAAMTYSLWPWRLLGLVAPNLFGNPVYGDYWGYGNFWEDALYVGMVPFLLALSTFYRIFKRRPEKEIRDTGSVGGNSNQYMDIEGDYDNRKINQVDVHSMSTLLFVLTVVSIIIALGKNTPVFPWLFRHIPTFDMFQSPTRFSIWMVFSLAVAAGIGSELWRKPRERGLYWTRLGTAAAFAVLLTSGFSWLILDDVVVNFKSSFGYALALAGVWGTCFGILSLTAPEKEHQASSRNILWRWGVVLCICLDLAVAGWGLNPGIDKNFYKNSSYSITTIRDVVGDGRVYLSPKEEYELRYNIFFNFETFEPDTDWDNLRPSLLPNINMLDKIPYVNNYDPLVPNNYAKWMENFKSLDFNMSDDLFDFMGVSVIETLSQSENNGVRFVPRGQANRIHWVPCHRFVPDGEYALELIFSGKVNMKAEVVLENEDATLNQACYVPDFSPDIKQDTGNTIIVTIDTPTVGWLVLADIWYPGWKASIDGEIVDVLKANFAFKALEIPPGRHEIIFFYRPISFYVGAVISLLTISTIGWYAIKKFRKNKKMNPNDIIQCNLSEITRVDISQGGN